ncbi:MAG TPA: EAL domain-containing protein [Burkholderiaceae bacterium]|nr:EAL domain-containing protein [Burkholderiaceae bacterium]
MSTAGARILVVDDDSGGRRLTRAILAKAGFRVTEAADGKAGLEAMQAGLPDLVLMDVSMPVMDGFAACAGLRRLAGGDRIPVIMMTGLDDTESIERAFEVGATDFVTKPINWTVLPHRVRYMLRASSAINDLQQNERRLSNAQRIGEMGDWEWNLLNDKLSASAQAWRIFGHERQLVPATGDAFFATVHDDDRDRWLQAIQRVTSNAEGFAIELRIPRPGGGMRHVHQQVEVIECGPDGAAVRLAGAVHDITRRKDAEEQIRRLAYYDALTGLPNRLLFTEQLSRALAHAERHGRRLATMFVDLDNFKRVNDTLGHRAGDQLLREASARLAAVLRAHDSVARSSNRTDGNSIARLGGDEFIVLLTDVMQAQDAARAAHRLVATLAEPFTIEGTEIFCGGSVGVSLFPEDGCDVDTLLMNADTAMYRAKARGRGAYQLYDKAMNESALDHLRMETRLRRAIERDEFVLHYQPRINVATGRIVGAEALIRWQHPERGLLQPSDFIPLVEQAGLVIPIGEWAIESACAQTAKWHKAGLQPVPVAVNLASTHLRERGLPMLVAHTLERHGVPARCLEIEVTESILLADPELAVRIAQQLSEMGILLSLDDFGTGYSSMGYLKRLPLAALKIDRSFVRDLESDPEDEAIVSAIIALARSLKLRVVAEGVESTAQLEILKGMRCDEYQGFLSSRPLDPAEFAELLAQREMRSTAALV